VATSYPSVHRWKEANLLALSEITCAAETCDTTEFTRNWQSNGPDYIVDLQTHYFLAVPTSSAENPGRFTPLDYSETAFITKCRQPVSYTTPDGEIWRLYSRETNDTKSEIIIGYAEKAQWKMLDTPHSQIGIVDSKLKSEADEIAASTTNGKVQIRAGRNGPSADGFQVVDANTKKVVEWDVWLPEFLPKEVKLPTPGLRLYIYNSDLYFVQTDTNGRLLATSLIEIGNLWSLAGSCGIACLSMSFIARAVCRRFLRGYFAVTGIRVPTIDEAQRGGEGQSVEFKRGLSDDEIKKSNVEEELLKTIAAFANTNNGVIFIGIDDSGHVKGLALDFKQKDRLERKIRQLVRNRIRPTPPFNVSFEDVRGLLIAKIVVARGESPLHMIDGVIYVRYGSSDVQAQPEDLRRLVSMYAV